MITHAPIVPLIANDKKSYYSFTIDKNEEKGGSWLAAYIVTNREGTVKQIAAEAFSNAGAAKRWCASAIGRKSVRWSQVVEDNKFHLTAKVEVKNNA